jgi:hypothetical protein
MTLIEILFQFRYDIRQHGREYAEENIRNMCDESIWNDIFGCVDNKGNFLTVDDETGNLVKFSIPTEN